MARTSASAKAKTHARIIVFASRRFREKGLSVGIGDIMKGLGMTHGGFYRHFRSKDELLADVIRFGLEEVISRLESGAEKLPPQKKLESIISNYLSMDHVEHPERWCILAVLAPELGRQSHSVRKTLDLTVAGYSDRLSKFMPGKSEADKQHQVMILISAMAGAIAMIRATGDAGLRRQILGIAREYYLHTFAGQNVRTN